MIGFLLIPSRSYSGSGSGSGFISSASSGSYGLLWLEVDPEESKITLDGHYIDLHVWLISIPPGSHELVVEKAGYQDYFYPFEIEAGQSLHLDIHLEKELE